MTDPREIIDFWFGAPGSDAYGVFRDVWFERDGAFDAAIRAGFLGAFEAAAAGTLTGWRDAPESCLALILLVDQFPRNLFRGTPRAFATDPCALDRSEEHTSELQSLMRISYAVFCLKKQNTNNTLHNITTPYTLS